MKFRTAYDGKSKERSKATALICSGVSKTQQQDKEAADINVLVRRFGLTGMMPQGLKLPTYQDFDGIFDFQTAQNALVAADRAFMRLPADVRERFGNRPQKFIEFCSDEENLPELRKMGLADPVKEVPKKEVLDVRVIPEENNSAPKV